MIEEQNLKPMSLVKLTEDYSEEDMAEPFSKEYVFVFLGEIANMQGHGVFVEHETGKVFSGYHIERFEEVIEEG